MSARILVIEDSTHIAGALTQILESRGYTVVSCQDGMSGWAYLQQASEDAGLMPDIVLLDLNIPGMDGLTVLQHIRMDERLSLLPVVILTVESDTQVRLQALEAGANDYLLKPVQALELLARIRALLNWRGAELAQQRRLSRLVEAGQILLSTLDMDSVLRQVMRIARAELDTAGTSIWLRNAAGNLECRAAYGEGSGSLIGIQLEAGQGIAGWVLQHKQTLRVANVRQDQRFEPEVDRQIQFHTHNLIAVPLVERGVGIGVLEAANKRQGEFSAADQAWLEVLAPMAAAAIANARLFHTLRQRTRELQARNEELDAFAHTVAHDLKSPLASVIGFAETLTCSMDKLSPDELQRGLRIIARSSRKMDRIVDALLLLAYVRTAEVVAGPVDMVQVVREALNRLAAHIEQKQATIVLPPAWPSVQGYAPWLEEVWVNYISNALKYGGDAPRIELGAEVQPDRRVRFWVRDDGPGISPENQARLFTPFVRLGQKQAAGHGLGLSIVQRIMERMGGEVGVESQVGGGSTFYFTLPSFLDENVG